MRYLIALLLVLIAYSPQSQQASVLQMTVTIVDADGRVRPVPRHALLISDNPVSSAPQRVVTTIDGTAQIRLKPGNYTIESEEPLVFQGKSYEWVETVDVIAARDTVLALTAENAGVGTPASGGDHNAGGASALLLEWQHSVVTIWSPTRRGSGFVVDARGLIATSERLVGSAAWAEVQVSPSTKVRARVLVADADRDVAILWADPLALTASRPLRLGSAIRETDKVFAIEAPLGDHPSLVAGAVSKVTPRAIVTSLILDDRSAGTPVLNAAGEVIAIATTGADDRAIPGVVAESIPVDGVRTAIADADKKMTGAAAPAGAALPVEPERRFEDDDLREAAKSRSSRSSAYLIGAEDFEVALITPVMMYAARYRDERTTGQQGGSPGSAEDLFKARRALQEFANWDDYVQDHPPVVMIRVMPKMVEGFWKSLARGAAETQGVSLPAIKHVKARFADLRLRCGDTEVVPVHPFRIEQRVSQHEVLFEGLYVFAPEAIAPACGPVTLTLFSEKAPGKGDARTIDPRIVQQVWDDFEAYRRAAK